jgi:hypothetical protein
MCAFGCFIERKQVRLKIYAMNKFKTKTLAHAGRPPDD